MTSPRASANLWRGGVLYIQVREKEEELVWAEVGWAQRGGRLTRRAQEDVHQVLIEDEGGRPLGEQVEAD